MFKIAALIDLAVLGMIFWIALNLLADGNLLGLVIAILLVVHVFLSGIVLITLGDDDDE